LRSTVHADEAEDGRQDQWAGCPRSGEAIAPEWDGADLIEYDYVGGCALTDEEPAAGRRHRARVTDEGPWAATAERSSIEMRTLPSGGGVAMASGSSCGPSRPRCRP
jgi:hypothetical protein